MIGFLTEMISQFEGVIIAAIAAAAVLYVGSVWWRTKALVPTATAVVLAAVVVWAVQNVHVLEGEVRESSEEWMNGKAPEADAP